MIARTPEEFKVRQNIIIYPGHEVTAVEPASGRIRVLRREDGKEWWEPYDQLLLATGASPIRPPLPHIDAHGIYTVNSLADGIALRAAIDARPPHRALVVGGGYIGLEMAENLIRVGIPVDLVEQSPQLMTSLDPDMAALVARAAESLGISLHLGEAVTGFEVIHGAVSAVITDRGSYPAELVVLGLGVQPNSDLAR
ncbi:MAG: FAD-dependent oxidoreductase, partial [Firmicutes bacterium]|nr:FAD-dependent oxidoreductase [Bacillota bacterium]